MFDGRFERFCSSVEFAEEKALVCFGAAFRVSGMRALLFGSGVGVYLGEPERG